MMAITAFCSKSGGRRLTSRWARTLGLDKGCRLLTAQEERALAQRARQGDPTAREALIVSNLPLAIRVASHYDCAGMTFDDLVQEGFCGLIRAVESFDPQTHGTRFSSYAVYWIAQAIQRAVARNASLVRVPDYLYRLQYQLQRLLERQRNQQDDAGEPAGASPPCHAELAAALGISSRRLDLVYRSQLDQRLPQEPAAGEAAPLDEQVADRFSGQEELERADQVQALYRAVEALPPVEAWVIRQRFRLPERPGGDRGPGAAEPTRNIDALAETLGVSRKRVHQLERSALRRLRALLGADEARPASRQEAQETEGSPPR